MSEQSVQFLVEEIRDLRTRMDERFDTQDERFADISAQVAVLNTQMKSLIGNGQPGIIQHIQTTQSTCKEACNSRLNALEQKRAEWMGKHTIVASLAAAVISLVIATHDHWMALLKKMP